VGGDPPFALLSTLRGWVHDGSSGLPEQVDQGRSGVGLVRLKVKAVVKNGALQPTGLSGKVRR